MNTASGKNDLIRSAVIVPTLTSDSKDAALDEVLASLAAAGRVADEHVAAVREAIAARESVGSTGIGNGVAVPHMKGDAVDDIVLAFARSTAGIEYQAVDGREVHLVFMVLAPEDAAESHLGVLRWISGLARNEDFRRFALQTDDAEGLRELLHEMGGDS